VEKYGGLVAFGRHFITNVSRIFGGQWSHLSDHIAARSSIAPEGRSLSLTRYNRDTFYATEAATGYSGYPFINNVGCVIVIDTIETGHDTVTLYCNAQVNASGLCTIIV